MLVVIDAATRIRAILPELDEMVADGLITVQPVEVVAYRGRGRQPAPE
jgi:PII-like signaling protein